MPRKNNSENLRSFFKKSDGVAFRRLDRFYEVLRNLRYEGKQNFKKNVDELRVMLGLFQKQMLAHRCLEEKILFPYLGARIPRLEPLIGLLISEHKEFNITLKELKVSLTNLRINGQDSSRAADRIGKKGIYFICLSRNHLQAERQGLYKAADRQLRPGQKRALIGKIAEDMRGAQTRRRPRGGSFNSASKPAPRRS